MNHISRGSLSHERLAILLTQCKFRSEKTLAALHEFLVLGSSVSYSATIHGVSTSNLERDIKKVNDVADFVVRIEEYDWNQPRKSYNEIKRDRVKMRESLLSKNNL